MECNGSPGCCYRLQGSAERTPDDKIINRLGSFGYILANLAFRFGKSKFSSSSISFSSLTQHPPPTPVIAPRTTAACLLNFAPGEVRRWSSASYRRPKCQLIIRSHSLAVHEVAVGSVSQLIAITDTGLYLKVRPWQCKVSEERRPLHVPDTLTPHLRDRLPSADIRLHEL